MGRGRSLKHRELSSKELRELDYKVASPKPGHPDVERTLEVRIAQAGDLKENVRCFGRR